MERRGIYLILLSFIILLLVGVIANFSEDLGITGKGVLTKRGSIEAASYSPKDGSVLHSREVTFKWNIYGDYTQKRYQIVVDDNLAFTSPESYFGLGKSKEKTIILRNEGKYFWRVRSHDEDGWGKFSEIREFTLTLSGSVCDDGTEIYTCSKKKPLYCNGLKLIDDCIRCGCPNNGICKGDGSCIIAKVIEGDCSDGTKLLECSLIKPLFCTKDKDLIYKSGICGCPEGSSIDNEGIGCNIKIEAPIKTGFNLFKFFSDLF